MLFISPILFHTIPCMLSHCHVQLFETPWTVAHQAPQSMGFSRQEYWSELSFSSPGDLPDPGLEPRSPALQADSLPSEPPGKPPIAYHLPQIYILISWLNLHKLTHYTAQNYFAMFKLDEYFPNGSCQIVLQTYFSHNHPLLFPLFHEGNHIWTPMNRVQTFYPS